MCISMYIYIYMVKEHIWLPIYREGRRLAPNMPTKTHLAPSFPAQIVPLVWNQKQFGPSNSHRSAYKSGRCPRKRVGHNGSMCHLIVAHSGLGASMNAKANMPWLMSPEQRNHWLPNTKGLSKPYWSSAKSVHGFCKFPGTISTRWMESDRPQPFEQTVKLMNIARFSFHVAVGIRIRVCRMRMHIKISEETCTILDVFKWPCIRTWPHQAT